MARPTIPWFDRDYLLRRVRAETDETDPERWLHEFVRLRRAVDLTSATDHIVELANGAER